MNIRHIRPLAQSVGGNRNLLRVEEPPIFDACHRPAQPFAFPVRPLNNVIYRDQHTRLAITGLTALKGALFCDGSVYQS